MPAYFAKAAVVLSVSELTTENFRRVLRLRPEKIRTVYFGPARDFRPIEEPAALEAVRARYGLPERFVLTLTKRGGDGRKNLGTLLEAYARYHALETDPYKLVVGGKDCQLFRSEYGIPQDGYGRDILFPGWLDQKDLPAIYSLAGLYLYPSRLEAFPIPITEAMACGAPIVTSDANGLREIAGDAALFVDPEDPDAIAAAVGRVLRDTSLRTSLVARGFEQGKRFSWEKCARETLAILEDFAPEAGGAAPA
jgi:glycosyltransferase involved in cell wall biosynthesis